MKKTMICGAVALCAVITVSHAARTISFTQAFDNTEGMATNFANSGGTATDGLTWGIIVDNAGNGFLGNYAIQGSGASATIVGGDDVLYLSAQETTNTTGQFELGTSPGSGGAGTITAVSFTGTHGAATEFAIIWFDSTAAFDNASNTTAGILRNSDLAGNPFVVGTDPSTVTISEWARGEDPIRAATGLNITFVPEPSSTALLGLGGLALILRRRR